MTAPPDEGLQAERTSLSWARTWAVLAVDVVLVAKLVAETSFVAAAAVALLAAVPVIALARVRLRHERRVHRFVRAGVVHQTDWAYNALLVVVVVALAVIGLAAVLVRAGG